MIIGGLQRFSLIDYPDKICAIVFTQGCNFRCPYCHNPELIELKTSRPSAPREDEILSFLDRRKGKLDAVTITGGEPLLQSGLEDFLSKLKALGYLIKLDTNGSFPSRLARIIDAGTVDYIAMDIKMSLEKYETVVGQRIETAKISESINVIMDSVLDHEFRTTAVKPFFEEDDFVKIGRLIEGSRLHILQRFVSAKSLDESPNMCSYSDGEMDRFRVIMEGFVQRCIVR
jgi:pyruvate formate lyase activating enzyme